MTAIPKPKRIIDHRYVRFAKTFPCMLSSMACQWPIDPHHTVPVSLGGSDYLVVPLCRYHHDIVQRHPAAYKAACDERIRTLNAEYRKLHLPKKRPVQRMKVTLKEYRVSCDCWRKGHAVPKSKAEVAWKQVVANTPRHIVIVFTCPTTNERKEAQI